MRRLTLKQELFIKLYLQSRNGTESAFQAYNCKLRATASQIAYENMRKPEIYNTVRNTLMTRGVSLESIIQHVLKSLMEIALMPSRKVKVRDSLRANEILLKLSGYL